MIKSETSTSPDKLFDVSYTMADEGNILKIPERLPKIGVIPTNSTRAPSDVNPRSSATQLSVDIVNWSNKPIYVKLQNNIPLVIEPSPNHQLIHPADFCVKFHMNIRILTRSSATETANYLSQIKHNGLAMSTQTQELLAALEDYINRRPNINRRSDTQFNFTLEGIINRSEMQNNNIVHHQETNIIVGLRKEDLLRPHPSSPAGLQLTDLYSNPETTDHAGLFIKIIDNHQTYPSRFFYSGKQLIEVPCHIDQTKANGVYAVVLSKEGPGLRTRSEFLTYEQAEVEFGLFKTREEAMTAGNPERFFELEESKSKEREKELSRELAELRHRTELERQKAEAEKHAADLKKIQDEQELQTLKARNAWLQQQSEQTNRLRDDLYADRKYRREDHYDERSSSRKEKEGKNKYQLEKYKSKKEKQSAGMKFAVEAMKLAPVIVMGGIALYGLMNRGGNSNGFVIEH